MFFCPPDLRGETGVAAGARNIQGWEHSFINGTAVAMGDSASEVGKVSLEVPADGAYQLFVRLYHDWRNNIPFVYFIGKSSMTGRIYGGSFFSETRWYLPPGIGRWEYRSFGPEFWDLKKGPLEIEFWLESVTDCWTQKTGQIEGKLALAEFRLVPVVGGIRKTKKTESERNRMGIDFNGSAKDYCE